MITGLMLFASIFILMGLTSLIMTGILHIWMWIERRKDEKKDLNERYEKYLSMFKYNP